ncbi:MAG TPA: hypothetical protein VIM62_11315 [Acidobacteriaceae bacterium]
MFGLESKPRMEGFPEIFRPQPIGAQAAVALANLPRAEIARYFRSHQETADALLSESYDKRYGPSTFIKEESEGYSVGWYSNGYECVQHHSDLAYAASDYLLFSLGKGRCKAPKML